MPNETTRSDLPPAAVVDEPFMLRAMDEADLNALRLALYQATGDEDLARMRVERVHAHGGATLLTVLAKEDHSALKQKVIDFVRCGPRPGANPDETELKRLMELLLGRKLSKVEFDYHKTIPAFEDFPLAASWHGEKPILPDGFHIAIIGAGISGIATAVQFQRLGIPFTVYERRHELGGTWSINTYPDVRVDTTNFIYQYSFEKNYPWSEYFARQTEVRKYLEYVARKYGVFSHIRFDSDAKSARFNEDEGQWVLEISSAGVTEKVVANVVVAASGLFGVPKELVVAGADSFKGQIVHTANWNGALDFEGRNVAILGNGSTGVQLLSKVAATAAQVNVFQRTPQWISPRERYGEPVSAEMRWLLDTVPHFWNWNIYSMLTMGLSHQPVQDIDAEWQKKGGFVSELNDQYRASLSKYIRSRLGDRSDLVAKVTPKHAPLARRLIVDNGWYDALLRPNVELITQDIERLTPTGIRTVDGVERPVDLIIAAIGFEATKYVWPMDYFGKDGASLHDQWKRDGTPRAYLSITVPNFPNLFLHYGPNSQPRAGSLMSWQEIWARYSAQAVVDLIESGHKIMSVKPEVFEKYNSDLDRAAENIVWSEPASRGKNYYTDANGRSSVNAPWRVEDYYQFFLRQSLDDFILD